MSDPVIMERFGSPTDAELDKIEASGPRTVVHHGSSYVVIHGPPLPHQNVEFCQSTATHLRNEAKSRPYEAAKLEALATVYDLRAAR